MYKQKSKLLGEALVESIKDLPLTITSVEKKKALEHPPIVRPQPPKRPQELEGTTYKIRTPLAADALYVTINDLVEEDGRRRPYVPV